jgi:hypothetical protein
MYEEKSSWALSGVINERYNVWSTVVNPTLHPTNLQFTSHTGLDLCGIPYLKL